MAVYRDKRGANRRTLGLIGAGIVILIGLVGLAIAFNPARPAGETPRSRAQAGLRDVNGALDLFAIEYPKAQAGSPSGAGPALTRARTAFDRARPDLATVDPAAAGRFDTALRAIEAQAAARAPAAGVVAAVTQLRADIGAWLQAP